MCEELKVNPVFFLSLTQLQFDLLKLSASCALCWFKRLCRSVCFCLHTQTSQAWMSIRNHRSLSPTRAANMSEFFCIHASEPTSVRLLKWSYLSQHSSPMTGGMEGTGGGIPGDRPQADELLRPARRWGEGAGGGIDSAFLGEKKSKTCLAQVNIYSHCDWDGDRLITSSISQNRLKWECTELSGVSCTWISVVMSSYNHGYENNASYHNQCI